MLKKDRHTIISYVKSFIRICGFLLLLVSIPLGVAILIMAELFGILEEM